MPLACCSLGKVLGVGCHYFPPSLDIPTFAARYLHVCTTREILVAKKCGTTGENICPVNLAEMTTSTSFLGAFTCRKLWHGTDGFTSPPKEGVLRIFFALKIRRLRPGLNRRTLMPEASTLTPRPPKPCWFIYSYKKYFFIIITVLFLCRKNRDIGYTGGVVIYFNFTN